MINCYAKLFTKVVTNRIHKCIPTLISGYQTGFIHGRLISDNGWITQALMKHLQHASPMDTTVGVLLDQEKAYDRVHPDYLRSVMLHMGFPPILVGSLTALFFDTNIHISINDWLSAPIPQNRGLRQGDPLSPLLFNIALEPFIRTVMATTSLQGCPIPDPPRRHASNSPSVTNQVQVKLLAYADDIILFLRNTEEWTTLQTLLADYGEASNVKINLGKTTILSMTGQPHEDWNTLANKEHITS